MVNTKDILDSALSLSQDNSAATSARALMWLNETIRDILNQPRSWELLKTTASIVIAANKITLPADFGEVRSIKIGSLFLLTPDEQYTEEEAFAVLQAGGSDTLGFTITATELTFIPSATGTATLSYEKTVKTPYADNVTTIFPEEFSNLLINGVRKSYYQYDRDDLFTTSVQLYIAEMKNVKDLDNHMKAIAGYGSRTGAGRK